MITAAAAMGVLIVVVVGFGLWLEHANDRRVMARLAEERRLEGIRQAEALAQRQIQDLRTGIREREGRFADEVRRGLRCRHERRWEDPCVSCGRQAARPSDVVRVVHVHDEMLAIHPPAQFFHGADHHEPHFPTQLAAVEAIPVERAPYTAPEITSTKLDAMSCGPSGYDSLSSSFDIVWPMRSSDAAGD